MDGSMGFESFMKVGDLVRYGSSTGVVLNKKTLEHFDDDGGLFYHKSFLIKFLDQTYAGWYLDLQCEKDFEVISEGG